MLCWKQNWYDLNKQESWEEIYFCYIYVFTLKKRASLSQKVSHRGYFSEEGYFWFFVFSSMGLIHPCQVCKVCCAWVERQTTQNMLFAIVRSPSIPHDEFLQKGKNCNKKKTHRHKWLKNQYELYSKRWLHFFSSDHWCQQNPLPPCVSRGQVEDGGRRAGLSVMEQLGRCWWNRCWSTQRYWL